MKTISLLLVALLSTSVMADSIELSNGKVINGTFQGRDGDNIKFDVDGISMSFQAKDVKNIAIGSSATATSDNNKKPSETTTTKQAITFEAGTILKIKLNETLNSGRHATGHKFTAVTEGSLSKNGSVVVPAGSKVYGVISEAVKARRLAGSGSIIITLTEININGNIVPIKTNALNALTESTAKGTAGKVVKGAAIGALANGSSGASDGAKIGLGLAILKGGNQVVVPAGTLLDFSLTAPFTSK